MGEWKVTCHGYSVFFNLFGDRKVIAGDEGHNVVLGQTWGHFRIVHLPNGEIGLDYNHQNNFSFMRKVFDRILPSGDGYTGDFFYAGIRLFRFSLKPIKQNQT